MVDLQHTPASRLLSSENTNDTIEVTSQDAHSRLTLLLRHFPNFSSSAKKKLICFSYILFLFWQVIGLILYSIRTLEATIVAKHASFQYTDIEMFSHSEKLELLWLISLILNTGVVIRALKCVPSFLGYCTIVRDLVGLPSFWSLLSLYVICIIGFAIIIEVQNDSAMEIALILALVIAYGAQIILIVFLNFTQINCSQSSSFELCAFFKVNIFIAFLAFFVVFFLGSLQFALNIYGIDDDKEIPSHFMSIIGEIRRLTLIVLTYRIYIFHWEKLFVDNRNILSHHDRLDDVARVSSHGNAPSSPDSEAN